MIPVYMSIWSLYTIVDVVLTQLTSSLVIKIFGPFLNVNLDTVI